MADLECKYFPFKINVHSNAKAAITQRAGDEQSLAALQQKAARFKIKRIVNLIDNQKDEKRGL